MTQKIYTISYARCHNCNGGFKTFLLITTSNTDAVFLIKKRNILAAKYKILNKTFLVFDRGELLK